jgi:hypothetical protein
MASGLKSSATVPVVIDVCLSMPECSPLQEAGCRIGQISRIGDVGISPVRARHTSPGQRPIGVKLFPEIPILPSKIQNFKREKTFLSL